jgi:hypothetical protein
MKLYQIVIPVRNNAGMVWDNYHVKTFDSFVLEHAGGFTQTSAFGRWLDKPGGTEYQDWSTIYNISCTPSAFEKICAKAMELYEDQSAIFTAEIGTATIHCRPTTAEQEKV